MNDKTPLVVVIIPTFNSLKWLPAAIDSALAQTYPRVEVIVVDDGSTDGTGDFLHSSYGQRIEYLYKENGGLSSARNYGLRHSEGDLVQFLDADDLLLPTKIAAQVEYMVSHPETAVVYSDCQIFLDESSDPPRDHSRKYRYRSGDLFLSLLEGNYIFVHAPLIRREWIERVGGFDETLSSAEDWDFWLRIAWQGGRFHYLEGPPLALCRRRTDSMLTDSINHVRNGLRIVNKVRQYTAPASPSLRRCINRAEGQWLFVYGKVLMRRQGLSMDSWLSMIKSLIKSRDNFLKKLDYIVLFPLFVFFKKTPIWGPLKHVKDAILRKNILRINPGRG